MSNELEAAIRTSLQESSEHLTPDPDLAGQVRRATRRRRARLAIAGSLATAIIVCAGGYVVAPPGQHWPPWPANGYHAGHGGGARVRFALPPRTTVEPAAAAGPSVYAPRA